MSAPHFCPRNKNLSHMAKSNYNCSEQELYTICETAWNSCTQYITRFTAFKAKYTPVFITAKQAAVSAARNLPDEQQRNAAYETANVNLKKQGRLCCDKWQMLKRYIADAFPADQQKPMLEGAGYNYYEKAANNNWDSVKGLMTSGSTFIAAVLTDLLANDNMPATFQAEFNTAKSDFETLHQEFIQAEEDSRVGQDTKMNANNSIHADMMSMLLDGQEIFKNEEPLLKQFVFAELLYLASGTGTAGVRGHVTLIGTDVGIEGVKVIIKNNGKATETDADGKYEITQLASGKYVIIFEKEGYETKTITDFVVKIGTVSTLDVELAPAP